HAAHFLFGDAALEQFAGEARADLGGGGGAEIGRDQPFLQRIQRRFVERRLAPDAGNVVADPVRRPAKAGAQAVEPGRLAHAGIPIRVSWSMAVMRRSVTVPMPLPERGADASLTGAKFSAWPLRPSSSIRVRWVVPI